MQMRTHRMNSKISKMMIIQMMMIKTKMMKKVNRQEQLCQT